MRRTAIFVAANALLLVPLIASAQGAPQNLTELANLIVRLLSAATVIMVALGVVVYFWGIVYNMGAISGERDPAKIRLYFFWGILALFIMVSIWGILRILSQTLFNGNPPGTITG